MPFSKAQGRTSSLLRAIEEKIQKFEVQHSKGRTGEIVVSSSLKKYFRSASHIASKIPAFESSKIGDEISLLLEGYAPGTMAGMRNPFAKTDFCREYDRTV